MINVIFNLSIILFQALVDLANDNGDDDDIGQFGEEDYEDVDAKSSGGTVFKVSKAVKGSSANCGAIYLPTVNQVIIFLNAIFLYFSFISWEFNSSIMRDIQKYNHGCHI